jgi:hypothetical protein
MKTLIASAWLVVLGSSAARAATIRVPEDFPSVLLGVDAAAAGDTVRVGPGVWQDLESRQFGSATYTACAFIDQPITILGAGRDVTTIDASLADSTTASVLYARLVPTGQLTIEGLTLTGALVSANAYALRHTGDVHRRRT